MRKSRAFSLLEIMVGLALILMAAGAIGWKMHGFLETRRFRTSLEQLKSRILTAHRMAVNMQADWEGILKREGNHWTFEAVCLDPPSLKPRACLKLHFSRILFEGKEQSQFTFTFFSSGEIRPSGSYQFQSSKDEKSENWNLPEIFGKSAGSGSKKPRSKKLAPAHPSEA